MLAHDLRFPTALIPANSFRKRRSRPAKTGGLLFLTFIDYENSDTYCCHSLRTRGHSLYRHLNLHSQQLQAGADDWGNT
jgi:hypothetical protein